MSFSNPRRTAPVTRSGTDSGDVLSLKTNMTLRKGATFHSPTSSPTLSSADVFTPPTIRRSQTNLDDVIDAHLRRVALTLDTIDKSLAPSDDPSSSPSSPKKQALRDNSHPVPRGLLGDLPVVDPAMAKDEMEPRMLRSRARRAARDGDSALGTSIESSRQDLASSKKGTKASAITRSAAASSATVENLPPLSSRAVSRITEHILRPLRAKTSLKDFEPIILDVPRRIQEKEIVCLRDLEKTLIFMAPERTKTATLYLDFCLTSIRCIQATVEYLSDREQTRPADRPYTNGYFLDLADQIRQYAQQLAAAKDPGAEDSDVMDVDPTDEVKLFGGLHENGRPAELVRVRNGVAISMATGKPVDMDDTQEPLRLKRSLSEQLEEDDEALRSMARRKKNAHPDEYAPKKCKEPGCNKEFKRPCDLTKHEKTHSRPWKCPVPTCKYHDYGWPTEKEMDRHHNDKHSSAPPMYECRFKPCPYKSKRESNCKQHMEKAHGWTYVRTKTNGKKSGSKPGSVQQPTPVIGSLHTPAMTPPNEEAIRFPSFNAPLDFPAYMPQDDFDAMVPHASLMDFDLSLSPLDPTTPSTSTDASYSTFQEGPEFAISNEDLYAAHVQMPTPEQAAYGKLLADYPAYQPTVVAQPQQAPVPHISPIGQGNAMLYTPNSLAEVDEGFEDFPSCDGMGGDFQLFPSDGISHLKMDSMFGEIPSAGMGFSQPAVPDMFQTQPMDWFPQTQFDNL